MSGTITGTFQVTTASGGGSSGGTVPPASLGVAINSAPWSVQPGDTLQVELAVSAAGAGTATGTITGQVLVGGAVVGTFPPLNLSLASGASTYETVGIAVPQAWAGDVLELRFSDDAGVDWTYPVYVAVTAPAAPAEFTWSADTGTLFYQPGQFGGGNGGPGAAVRCTNTGGQAGAIPSFPTGTSNVAGQVVGWSTNPNGVSEYTAGGYNLSSRVLQPGAYVEFVMLSSAPVASAAGSGSLTVNLPGGGTATVPIEVL
jgi:hypothetical protein